MVEIGHVEMCNGQIQIEMDMNRQILIDMERNDRCRQIWGKMDKYLGPRNYFDDDGDGSKHSLN